MFVVIILFAFLDLLPSPGNVVCHGEHPHDLHVDSSCIRLKGFGRNRELEKRKVGLPSPTSLTHLPQKSGMLAMATSLWR